MSLSLILIDCRAPYLWAGAPTGVLGLPLGESSVLDRCLANLKSLVEKDVIVLETTGEEGVKALSATSWPVRCLNADGLIAAVQEMEASDRVLLIDARYWPIGGYDRAGITKCLRQYHGVSYGIVLGSDLEDARELVDRDTEGRVRRVQRLYNAVSWPEVASSAIAYAVVPAPMLRELRFRNLEELRAQLSSRGALSSDAPVMSETLDLACERGFLSLHERVLVERGRSDGRFRARRRGVLLAPDCRIDDSVRLVPPVVVQEGAHVEEGAKLIGPVLIGKNSRIERDAIVAQSVIAPGTVVMSGRTVRHRVIGGVCNENTASNPSKDYVSVPLGRNDRYVELSTLGSGRRWRLHRVAKRGLDLLLSGAGLLVLLPLLLVITILIKLDSRGPVFFAHRRERRGGRDFPCIKFRTMEAGAHLMQRELYKNNEVDGPQFKLREDPRVTRVGRWLRATNLDELPQLLNVLLGHMSLVGPRPSPFRENQICVPWRRARLSVRPGITGLWQVCRDNERRADFHQWIYYDMLYVRHFSFWLDMKILVATVLTLGGRWSVPLGWLIPRHPWVSDHPREVVAA